MNEKEKMKIALNLARQGIDLEKVEKALLDVCEYLEPIFDLAEKNKKILDKYDERSDT